MHLKEFPKNHKINFVLNPLKLGLVALTIFVLTVFTALSVLYARNCILFKGLVKMLFTKFKVQILPVVLHKVNPLCKIQLL